MLVGSVLGIVFAAVRTTQHSYVGSLHLGGTLVVSALGTHDFPVLWVPRFRHPLPVSVSLPLRMHVADVGLMKMLVGLVAGVARLQGVISRHLPTPVEDPTDEIIRLDVRPPEKPRCGWSPAPAAPVADGVPESSS